MKLNFDNPQELKKQINDLQPATGVCIFIDICGSTAIKKINVKEWILLIGNTIIPPLSISPLFKENVLKLIGDEIMIFIPDDEITGANESYATVLDLLKACISKNPPNIQDISLRLKAAIHYCVNSYNISYNENNDYYGIDIDLTARLMKKAEENKIVLSETFFQKVNYIEPSFLSECTKRRWGKFKGIGNRFFRLLTADN
jgi:class 3 adenylate cyclase